MAIGGRSLVTLAFTGAKSRVVLCWRWLLEGLSPSGKNPNGGRNAIALGALGGLDGR
ncbi:MAG: hypothetical protein R2867_19740 [Caldilineaceae bacterium]